MEAFARATPNAVLSAYRRRQPEETVLYQAVASHLPGFLQSAAAADRPVPAFVQREFEALQGCGILEKGAIRVRCQHCGFDRLVAFSCKTRSGLCPSCAARRMVEVASHVCEHVIDAIPVRQWVLTVPPPVRYLLAYNKELLSAVMRIFVQAVLSHHRQVATRELQLDKGARIESGVLCVPHRFNSALSLSPHLHALAADGVWVQRQGEAGPVFCALPAPSHAEISLVAWRTCERTVALLKKRGLWLDADPSDDRLAQEEPLLAALAGASIAGVLATGPNAGQRPVRVFGRAAGNQDVDAAAAGGMPKNAYGFDVHAGTRTCANDRLGRERMCQYLLRPPLSYERLKRLSDGRYRIAFKRAWGDGTNAVVVSGEELMARLAVLVPPPRIHMVRYFGVWARRSSWRRFVVPRSNEDAAASDGNLGETPEPPRAEPLAPRRYRMTWAQALRKVFEIDATVCGRCGQRGMQHIAVLTDASVIRRIAAAIDRRDTTPPVSTAIWASRQ